MRKAILALLLTTCPLFAVDIPCVNGVVTTGYDQGGAAHTLTNVSITSVNVVYDTQNPSGEQFSGTGKSRVISGIYYPTSAGVGAKLTTVILSGGKGFNGANQLPCYRAIAFGNYVKLQQYINAGFAVLTAFDSMDAILFASTWNAGTSVIHATRVLSPSSVGNNTYWPNSLSNNVTPSNVVYSYPYKVVVDGNSAHQETATVTAMTNDSGTGSSETFDLTVNETASFQHTSTTVEVPATQLPVQLEDHQSLLAWMVTNCGNGSYPCNAQDIRFDVASSDSYMALMDIFLPQNANMCSLFPGWYSSLGFGPTCARNNTATGWKFGSSSICCAVIDIPIMYAFSATWPTQDARQALRGVVGCPPDGTVTGCNAFAQSLSPSTQATGNYANSSPLWIGVGTADGVTAICTFSQTWPACPGNQYAALQANYNPSGNNYQVFPGQGHGLSTAQYPIEVFKVLGGGSGGAAGGSGASGSASLVIVGLFSLLVYFLRRYSVRRATYPAGIGWQVSIALRPRCGLLGQGWRLHNKHRGVLLVESYPELDSVCPQSGHRCRCGKGVRVALVTIIEAMRKRIVAAIRRELSEIKCNLFHPTILINRPDVDEQAIFWCDKCQCERRELALRDTVAI